MDQLSEEPMKDPVPQREILEDFDTYMEPFIGWRAWNVVFEGDSPEDIRLRSISYQKVWVPEEPLVAECVRSQWNRDSTLGKHMTPHKECGCGIHAVKSKEDAIKWQEFATSSNQRIRCVGEVKLWGVVYRYTRGYLAQYAYPSKLWIPHVLPEDFLVDEPSEVVKLLRKTYRGVEVRLI